jgi:hypothetical protein
MRCLRCNGLAIIEYLDHEPVQRCLLCSHRVYPPLPSTPVKVRCYYCTDVPAPGRVCCLACLEKARMYRKDHPKKRRVGPQLPVVTEV